MAMSAPEFVVDAPLYTRVEIRNFEPPSSIMRMCTGPECNQKTTWNRVGNINAARLVNSDIDFYAIAYVCGMCSEKLVVIYQLLGWQPATNSTMVPAPYFHAAVRKIGQWPAPEMSIDPQLEKRLGKSAGHYRKALLSRSQNYGIGAMAYLRRVVDDQTDELIDVMVELAETHEIPADEVEKLKSAKTETRYEQKIKVASELIPAALRPGGVNPLDQLYHHVSIGLHGRSDDECVAIFDDLRADFEYVFRNLHLQAEERRQFAARVQARAGKKS